MIYPEGYTEEDKVRYDNFHKNKIMEYGSNITEYDLVVVNIVCKRLVSISKGEEYVLTDEDNTEIKRIWVEYGQYNI